MGRGAELGQARFNRLDHVLLQRKRGAPNGGGAGGKLFARRQLSLASLRAKATADANAKRRVSLAQSLRQGSGGDGGGSAFGPSLL